MLASVPKEILFTILEHLECSQLLTTRLVNRTLNTIATEVLNRVHSPLQLRTTMGVKSFVYLMANGKLPKIYTKFEFYFEYIHPECIQKFATEIGPQVREYSFTKSYSSTPVLALLQISPFLEVLTLEGNGFRKEEILSFASDHNFPNYLRLRVIYCNSIKDDCSEVVKIIVSKAPNLKRIYLNYCGKTFAQSLQIIELLPSTTKINLFLVHLVPEENENVIRLSEATVNIDILYIHTSFKSQSLDMIQPIVKLLNSQSNALKILTIHSCSEHAIPIPPMHNLESLSLIPHRNWNIVALNPGDFPMLHDVDLYNPCAIQMFSTSTWATVTTLRLGSLGHRGTNLLNEELATVFSNLKKLTLRSTYSLENDLKCCFRHFTQIQELSLEFQEYDAIPNLWDSVTGGASYVEDLETLLNFRDNSPCAKDATLENLKLKKLIVTSCRPDMLNALLYVSLGGNFKLELLDLACHNDCNRQALQGPILENLSKYHMRVILR